MKPTPIAAIQGAGLESPLAGREVVVRAIVIGSTRKGFFVQEPERHPHASTGLFVFARRLRGKRPPTGARVDVRGRVHDHRAHEDARPTTQLVAQSVKVLDAKAKPPIEPVWIDATFLDCDEATLAERLNALEGMLVGVPADATFAAPSNPFGDYVVLPPGHDVPRTHRGGVRIDPERPLRWLPSFRIIDYDRAPQVNVGARLTDAVVGPLNYRAESYQIAATPPLGVQGRAQASDRATTEPRDDEVSILTLNGFNLDPHVENPSRVKDPRHDVDDDVGDGRYDMLARAMVDAAGAPDLVALQEIQDDDGAELGANVTAAHNYATLIAAIRRAKGPKYAWVDRPPLADADGGQPGGNIRNAFLYRPDRVRPVDGSVSRLGEDDPAFEDSRKPLVVRFEHLGTQATFTVVNVHLASKRHQHAIFAPERPGFDPREEIRVAQARCVRAHLLATDEPVYATGDFNDTEFSRTLQTLCGEDFVNLIESLPVDERFDYTHRGTAQALMHGLVRKGHDGARYEVLHGNELIGSTPGSLGDRPTDHAYVLARIPLRK